MTAGPEPEHRHGHAAGTVLWRPAGARAVEVAVVHRPRYGDWSLPKGKHRPGETSAACAVRETVEETGFRPVLGRPLGEISYRIGGPHAPPKVVHYFAGRAGAGEFAVNDEVDELRWLPTDEALTALTYVGDRQVLARFAAVPADARTILLVRHAKAGNRAKWVGDDDLRPLSPAGSMQAAGLRALLPLFGPDRVHAASRVRCVQTVAGVADELGVPVVEEPLLTEEGYAADPAGATRRLLALLGDVGVPVVCGQGGAIPAMIGRLADRSGLELDRIPCQKGSTWVLTCTRGRPHRLLAADYLASPLPVPD